MTTMEEPSSRRGCMARVAGCACGVIYVALVLGAGCGAWYYVVYVSAYSNFLQGARDVYYDARRGRVIVASLHADSVTVVDARGDGFGVVGRYVDHDLFGNAHGFAYDAERELVFVASYAHGSLAALDVSGPRAGGAVVGRLRDDVALHAATHAAYDARRRLVFVGAAGGHQGRKRVIQRPFNVGVFEAMLERKASTL